MLKYCIYFYGYLKIYTFRAFLVVFIPTTLIHLAAGEMYTAQVEIENISSLRTKVVKHIEKYLDDEQLRLNSIRLILKSVVNRKSNSKTFYSTKDTMLNPIDAFVNIKFLTSDLKSVLDSITNNSTAKELIKEIEGLKNEFTFPTNEDLSGAAIALTRLQDTYLLKTSALSSGVINKHCCTTELTADDCFEIGRQSYYSKNYIRTIEWMDEALIKLPSESENNSFSFKNSRQLNDVEFPRPVARSEIMEYILWAKEIQSIVHLTQNFVKDTVGMDFNDLVGRMVAQYMEDEDHDEDIMNIKEANHLPSDYSYSSAISKYEALCRREKVKETFSNPKLNCSYDRGNYYFLIGPAKKEILHLEPTIVMFHQILHDGEIEMIKNLSTPAFDTAQVVNYATGNGQKSQVRVSKSAWLTEKHIIVSKVNKRISLVTGLSMSTAEDLQVANYGLGGHYAPHYDFTSAKQAGNFLTEEEGNRIATFLIYMSDVEAGGSTVFPVLDIGVVPIKGSAVFWFNLLENGNGDVRTLHAACPVLLGQKWVSNKWIRERGQEFLRPCKK